MPSIAESNTLAPFVTKGKFAISHGFHSCIFALFETGKISIAGVHSPHWNSTDADPKLCCDLRTDFQAPNCESLFRSLFQFRLVW